MKRHPSTIIFSIFVVLLATTLILRTKRTNAQDDIGARMLELFPQADVNQDGSISDAEQAAASQRILRRYPRADKDGDGVLSNAEKRALLRLASQRKRNQGNPSSDLGKEKATHTNVKYGEHERQVFDLWLADSPRPTPLAIYIHGGGFTSGSKEKLKATELTQLLNSGISVAAINYRYSTIAPLPTPHHDARRALQFIRSKSSEYNIDKDKVATFGGSAGAQICMWLAFSDDMAKPDSADPIERESTRLTCVATAGGQTNNSAEFWRETIGPLVGTDKAIENLMLPFGAEQNPEKIRMAMWGSKTLEEANEIAGRYAAMNIISADDPPLFMSYGSSPNSKPPSNPKQLRGWLIHHVNLGIALKKKTDAIQHESHLKYPGAHCQYDSHLDFMVDKLLTKQ
ncbi:MAG: alpha/beta hydrolase fold domain-containing protein [Rubripirellula sp.]